ncbi:MAG: helix-turn-helix domain-containing protein [Cytophagaceae bacterium]|nr:helix-turn-helix domain-containing protein [Cytophagaceae bacterium]MBK9509297.1 helix-turn-helix domain-containing protein [Cytophagaceae bacterium]MBK9933706.1 helix-turn-helix domain-containing protein [Cytophagaceae bacterium]MBL0302580.1 helix-turn-helix domain-containing protein [Cytophagaceae bacterium]MBL0325406.1 helix-turn-helix domain-containing protein [Cytophagaceae bacterium]
MEKVIPKYTIEQLNQCDHGVRMNIDIRRLEDHLQRSSDVRFPHRHDFYNLIYITRGSGTHDVDFKRFTVVPHQLFFMNDSHVHEWNLSPDVTGFTMFFKKEFYNVAEPIYSLPNLPFFHNSVNEAQMVVFEPEEASIVEHLFEDMLIEFSNNQKHCEAIVKTMLKIILIRSLRIYQPQFERNGSLHNLSKLHLFESLIEQNFMRTKSVKDYAKIMNLSPNYLNAISSACIGKSAGEMIRDRIILETKRLLAHSSLSICEMSYKLGFDDCSYFIRIFKKAVGFTPEQFRKSVLERNN